MKLMDKIIKSKFGLSTFKNFGSPSDIVSVDDASAGTPMSFRLKDNRKLTNQPGQASELLSKFNEIEEIYVRNNEDAKDLITNLNGVVTISIGSANGQYEAIRVSYDALALDLNVLIKIYCFTSGDKMIFSKDEKQKNKFADILSSMNMSVDIVDLVNFE